MSLILVYDTETTGLPVKNAPLNDPRQPYITQIAAELSDDETGQIFGSMNFMIQPGEWEVSPEITAITGHTTEMLNQGSDARL